MSRRIEFEVRGELPPKKDGANSMWGKSSEFRRLVALRTAAAAALAGDAPLEGELTLELEITLLGSPGQRLGDLDNFITGVCDGLQAADARSSLAPGWQAEEHSAIHPRHALAIRDDDHVVRIIASKQAGRAVGYRVTITAQ